MAARLALFCAVLLALGGCAHHTAQPSAASAVIAAPPRTPLEQAALALQQRDFALARRLYADIAQATPPHRDAQLGLGEAWLGLGKAADALAVFNAVLAEYALDADALEGAGLASLELGNFDEAREHLRRVLRQRPDSWRALIGLGRAADGQANFPEAREWYQQALALRPNDPDILGHYGASRLRAGDYPGAETLLAQALRLNPADMPRHRQLLAAIAWQGRYKQALGRRGPLPLHEALQQIALIAWQRHDIMDARRLLQRALAATPPGPDAAATAANLARLEQELNASAQR